MASLSAYGRIEHWFSQNVHVTRDMVARLDNPPNHLRGTDAVKALIMRGQAHWAGDTLKPGRAPEKADQSAAKPADAPNVVQPAESAPAAEDDPPAAEFDACIWMSGALTIEGAEVLESGHVCLTAQQAEQLRQLLNRHYVPPLLADRPDWELMTSINKAPMPPMVQNGAAA